MSSSLWLFTLTVLSGFFALMSFSSYLAFSASNLIVKKMGKNLIAVVGKIMGLILAIMGTQMLIEGIKIAFNIT